MRAGFLVGAEHGHGVVTCTTPHGWSAPGFVTLSAGSAGLQVGIESADLVVLIASDRAVQRLFGENLQIGVGAAAAAGPVGEEARAGTDATMTAEIVSYARTRGLFAGIDLGGAVIKEDREALAAVYGTTIEPHEILVGNVAPPSEATAFLDAMRTAFPQ
jgi:lipid-binding SYLF domain-containing protein